VTLVVSDLHIGLEESLSKRGVHLIPQSAGMAERIVSIKRREGCDSIALLGDVKDQVLGITPWGLASLNAFFSPVLDTFKQITLIPGNHDGGIEQMLSSRVKLASSRGVLVEDGDGEVALLHGHAEPTKRLRAARTFVMGHRHFMLRVGNRSEPLWLRGSFEFDGPKKAVVLPPFNPLLTGSTRREKGRASSKSFVSRVVEGSNDMEAVLLDGTSLGRLRTLSRTVLEVEY
jgi:metallophosphoesterase superfamily enzyme